MTFRAINSCLVPVCALAGRAVLTVEGLAPAPGSLHPVQQAMVDRHASQCGYRTPGIVVSLIEGCSRPDLNEEWKLADGLPELFRLLAVYPNAQLVAGATEIGLRLTKQYERFPRQPGNGFTDRGCSAGVACG